MRSKSVHNLKPSRKKKVWELNMWSKIIHTIFVSIDEDVWDENGCGRTLEVAFTTKGIKLMCQTGYCIVQNGKIVMVAILLQQILP